MSAHAGPSPELPFAYRLLSTLGQDLEVPAARTPAMAGVARRGPDGAAPGREPAPDWKEVPVDVLIPTLHRELQDLLLFLQLPAAWVAVSRSEPPFLAVEPPLPHPHGNLVPQPGVVERLLSQAVRWPEPGEVSELALTAPDGEAGATLLWWVGALVSEGLDLTGGSSSTLYLHLVARVPEPARKPPAALFQRGLGRLEETSRLWVRIRNLQYQASLGQLVRVISHEVRNPLATVRASLQMGSMEASPSLRSMMEQAVRELDQTVQFMELLLGAARARPSRREPVDLQELAREVLQVFQAVCRATGVEARVDCPREVPPVVASRLLLRQALGNLVRNAIDVMPHGGQLTVSLWVVDSDWVAVAVTDSGPGLSPEDQRRIFQPFFTSKPDGNGLGLTVVRQIALAHGGELTVKSRPGEGATFALVLPQTPGRLSSELHQAVSPPGPP